MKYIYSIIFISVGFLSFGQGIQKEEKKRAIIVENPENYIQEGGVLTDELLKDKLPDKTLRMDTKSLDFIIHANMNINTDKGLEKFRPVRGDYDSEKIKWIEQNKELYNGMQNIAPEKYLTPEERMSHYKN